MTDDNQAGFELPKKLEKILAALAIYYSKNNNAQFQKIIVNSTYSVKEEWSSDNWNGGTYGHALYFQVPAALYYQILENIDYVSGEICKDINKIANVQNEFIEIVFLELQDDSSLENWREQSGVLMHPTPISIIGSQEQLARIWKPGYFRLFLSHKSSCKTKAKELKDELDYLGISCFVAHEDIKPTKEWQNEIEKALFSMDALVALMTDDFSDSDWTDQEIGVAIGRTVPIIAIRLGKDPYGFIGKYQGLNGNGKLISGLAREVYELLRQNSSLSSKLTESLVSRFTDSDSFSHANSLMNYLEGIEGLPPFLLDKLENAPNSNLQVRNAWEVKNRLPALLKRLRGMKNT